jgi:hypothetical protein
MNDPSTRALAVLVTFAILVALVFGTVLFVQHEADRQAAIRATQGQSATPDLTWVCPTDPSSPSYDPATAGRHVSARSLC